MIKNFINRLIKKSIIFHLFLFCFLVESAVVFGANSKKNIFREESGVEKSDVDKNNVDKDDVNKGGGEKNDNSKTNVNKNSIKTDEIREYANKNSVGVDEEKKYVKKNDVKSNNTINIVSKNDFTILANVDKIAITKYDLNNFAIMMKNSANDGNKNSKVISNKEYNKYLDDYINILKKRIIAEKSGVNLSEEEKNNLWDMFSKNLNTTLDLDKYCVKNNLDKDFVIYFLESNFLWYRYVESFLKQNISVDNETIDSVLEFIMKEQYLVRYNLSEIVLYFNNAEQKAVVLEKLNNIHNSLNSKNFGITAFSMSQASSAKNNGLLGWLYENELNGEIIKSLVNTRKGSIIKPFCVGEESGACFIFRVNDREKNVEISEGERNSVAQFIEKKMLEEKIGDVIHETKINVMINYD